MFLALSDLFDLFLLVKQLVGLNSVQFVFAVVLLEVVQFVAGSDD